MHPNLPILTYTHCTESYGTSHLHREKTLTHLVQLGVVHGRGVAKKVHKGHIKDTAALSDVYGGLDGGGCHTPRCGYGALT